QQSDAARDGLCRPIPDPSLRSGDADRGDARGAGRRRQGRQGALYRRLLDVRLAVPQDAERLRAPWLVALRHHAEPSQPPQPRATWAKCTNLPVGSWPTKVLMKWRSSSSRNSVLILPVLVLRSWCCTLSRGWSPMVAKISPSSSLLV